MVLMVLAANLDPILFCEHQLIGYYEEKKKKKRELNKSEFKSFLVIF
jgi:hypothetical protein